MPLVKFWAVVLVVDVNKMFIKHTYMEALEREAYEPRPLGLERDLQRQQAHAPQLVRRPPGAALLNAQGFYQSRERKIAVMVE